jgi:hypothetical protein
LTKLGLNVREEASKLGESGKEATVGIDAIHREPHFGFAAGCKRLCTLLDLVKTGEMGFDVREQDTAKVGEMRTPALHLKELYAEPFLQAGDGVADGGLRTIELPGRGRKASQLDNGLQDFPFIEGGAHHLNISNKSMHLGEKCDYRFEILPN